MHKNYQFTKLNTGKDQKFNRLKLWIQESKISLNITQNYYNTKIILLKKTLKETT